MIFFTGDYCFCIRNGNSWITNFTGVCPAAHCKGIFVYPRTGQTSKAILLQDVCALTVHLLSSLCIGWP